MGLSEKLTQIKSDAQSLLTYANSKTGESDTNLGEAVQRLIDGFGVGGSEQRVFTKVVDISDTFNVETTHTTTAYEYHLQQLVPIDYLYIFDDSSNKYLWHFKVENTEQDVCYDSYIVSNGYTRGMTCMNNVKGEKSTSYLIYPEYRNSYGCMYRLIIGRSSVTVYEGTYDVNVSVYRIDDDVTEPEPTSQNFECVIDTEFEITETNESSTSTVVGTIDLSEYGSCYEMMYRNDFNQNSFILVIDLLEDLDGTRTEKVMTAQALNYSVQAGRSGTITFAFIYTNLPRTVGNNQIGVSGQWSDGKIDITSRFVSSPPAYLVKGKYRARIFKCMIDQDVQDMGYIPTMENLHDVTQITEDKYLSQNREVDFSGWSISAYIELTEGTYVSNFSSTGTYNTLYDENKNFIKNIYGKPIFSVSKKCYVRFSAGAASITALEVYKANNRYNPNMNMLI